MEKLKLQKLPLDLSTFKELRESNYLYVDKTQYAYDLITGGRRFFLSRPRRFGKSLFVSTLKEILLGKKELFEGLWIHSSDYQWKEHGVIALDFSGLDITDEKTFGTHIHRKIESIAKSYNVELQLAEGIPGLALSLLVEKLHEKYGRVAILIDEYDNPILHALKDPVRATAIRDRMQPFFATIKALDEYVNFVFITGVSSFAKAGLFSGMNNLQILTLNENFAGICGYTDEEIDRYFSDYIQTWADKEKINYSELRTQIKQWYNGYHFGEDTVAVYNPFSFMNALHVKKFENFWFQSGTPKFLIDVLKKEPLQFDDEKIEISRDGLGTFDVGTTPIPALMFQTGYLTIKNYNKERNFFTLDYPNHEVKTTLQKHLLEVFTAVNANQVEQIVIRFRTMLEDQKIEDAILLLKQLFAHIPYQLHIKEERFYHALLQMVCITAGMKAQSEYSTSHGRIDLVLDLPKIIYVIEIKFNESAQIALQQIEERRYYEQFLKSGKKVILLGLAFKREPNNFDIEYVMKPLQ